MQKESLIDQTKKSLKKLKGDFASSSDMAVVTAAIKLEPAFLASQETRLTNNTLYSSRHGGPHEQGFRGAFNYNIQKMTSDRS